MTLTDFQVYWSITRREPMGIAESQLTVYEPDALPAVTNLLRKECY